jgi:hypothetical protein
MKLTQMIKSWFSKEEAPQDSEGNCWSINLIPEATRNDRSTWKCSSYIGSLSKQEIIDMATKDVLENNVIPSMEGWSIEVERGIVLQWAA